VSPFFDALEEQLRTAARAELASRPPAASATRTRQLRRGTRIRKLTSHALPLTVALASIAIFVGALVFLHHGNSQRSAATGPNATQTQTQTKTQPVISTVAQPAHPLALGAISGPTKPFSGTAVNVLPATITLAAEATDPHGGLPWAMRTNRTTTGETCVLVGRLQGDQVGALGQDGAFENDARFHPISSYSLPSNCDQTDARGHAFIDVDAAQEVAAADDEPIGPSTNLICRSDPAAARQLHTSVCPWSDLRHVQFGLLGPDATSITYRTSATSPLRTERTGPDGAYLVLGPPQKRLCEVSYTRGTRHDNCNPGGGESVAARLGSGMIVAVHYRDGSTCDPAADNDPHATSYGCQPVGYVAPVDTHVTAAQVRAPIKITVIHATRYCAKAGLYVACDGAVPHGYTVLRGDGDMTLVQWSWTARVAASGRNSGYEFAGTGAAACFVGSSSGPSPARAGQHVIQQALGSCGTDGTGPGTIAVEYRTNVGPGGAGFASPPEPGHDGQPLVGIAHFTLTR
jgi:hypothetical protein